ncbi:MAG TPA: LuxR C-terminal-related transcriptional regulator, partial [Solirubrobacterales bacterium]|nr:LuxR C-terminal-related transcriptional regulator [Solirubrobacterales bacterium]
ERDELKEAEAAFRSVGMETGPIPESMVFLFLLLIRSHLRFEQGDMEGAAEDFLALAGQGENLGIGDAPTAIASPWGVRALMAIGEHERAREHADRTMTFVRRWGAPSLVAHGMRALAAARGGEEEIELLQEAVAMAKGSFGDIDRIHALLELGQALRRAERRAEAREPLREALKLARRCGAVRAAKHARDELQATGETVRRFAPIGVESLTPSERRVADLAASGLTNRQIAQTLFVTVKTVESHLSAAYDKLDIDSRRQLPAALSEAADSDAAGSLT